MENILVLIIAAFIVGAVFSFIPKKELKGKETEDPAKRKGQLFLIAFVICIIVAIVFVVIDMNR